MLIDANKRPINIQEEYFKLSDNNTDEWDFVRVPRPKGTPDNVWSK